MSTRSGLVVIRSRSCKVNVVDFVPRTIYLLFVHFPLYPRVYVPVCLFTVKREFCVCARNTSLEAKWLLICASSLFHRDGYKRKKKKKYDSVCTDPSRLRSSVNGNLLSRVIHSVICYQGKLVEKERRANIFLNDADFQCESVPPSGISHASAYHG